MFCVTILAGVLEIRQFADFIVGDKCVGHLAAQKSFTLPRKPGFCNWHYPPLLKTFVARWLLVLFDLAVDLIKDLLDQMLAKSPLADQMPGAGSGIWRFGCMDGDVFIPTSVSTFLQPTKIDIYIHLRRPNSFGRWLAVQLFGFLLDLPLSHSSCELVIGFKGHWWRPGCRWRRQLLWRQLHSESRFSCPGRCISEASCSTVREAERKKCVRTC